MKDQLILAAAMSSALLLASNANASSETRSAQACSRALADKVSAATSVSKVTYAYKGSFPESVVSAYFSSSYTFDVSVKDANSGLPIASATCVVKRDGTVLKLSSLQMRDSEGRLAAAF